MKLQQRQLVDCCPRTLPAALASLIPVNLDEQFAESNQAGLPLDPYDNFSCSVIDSVQPPFDPLLPEAGVEFRDLDSNDALSDGDQIVFSYVVDGSCRTETVAANVPTSLSGIIEFTFTGESDISSIPRRLVGLATFYNYQVDAGISSDTVQSGTVGFDLEFTNDTINRATFESGSVTLAGLDAIILTAPLDLTFDLVERELNPASGVFVEGWAVYAEELLLDNGYAPEDSAQSVLAIRLQQLKMQARMAINTILDIRVHSMEMSEDEALQLMTFRGFQEEGEAIGKWRRALLTAGQLPTYFVGYQAVRSIANDLRVVHPDWSDRQVHDLMLSHGSPAPRHLRTLIGM